MAGPFQIVPQRLSATVGPHELLDTIAAAEAAEWEARKARQRANEAVGLFSAQRGYRMHLTTPEARRLATIEADSLTAHRRIRT